MNPQNTNVSNESFNLPPISSSKVVDTPIQGNSQQAVVATAPPAIATNQPATASNQASATGTSNQSVNAPNKADDVDLIEKEWIEKIEEIIHKTHGDPYQRSIQMTALKGEYLQKRYDRTIGSDS